MDNFYEFIPNVLIITSYSDFFVSK